MRKISAYGPSLVVLFTAVVVLIVGPHAVRVLTDAQTEARIIRASARLGDNSAILDQLNQAQQDIATVVEPSVVHISAQRDPTDSFPPRPLLSTGSGWIWDRDGHVVTNYHVIQDSSVIDVQLYNGTPRKASVVGYDELTDIAVLKIDTGGLFPARRVDNNYDVQQGDMVFAFGSPFDFRFSMSSGVVSGKGRSVGVIRPGGGAAAYENFIQVDAAINPGNSGGPLTNHRGEVIGMNTAIATRRESGNSLDEGQFAGIGLAIPMNMIEPAVTQIIDNGVVVKGYLGVTPADINDVKLAELNRWGLVGSGVLVDSVIDHSPASDGGVMPEDVITHVNTTPIQTKEQLRSVISSMQPGDAIDLKIWRPNLETRTGMSMSLAITLMELPLLRTQGRLPQNHPTDHLQEFGIEKMYTSTERLAKRFGVAYHAGVLVESTTPGSDAEAALPPGSIITMVFGAEVRDVDEFFEELNRRNLAAGISIRAIRSDGNLSPQMTLHSLQQ